MGWKKSLYDDSEWCPSDRDPELRSAIVKNGRVVMGGFEVWLSDNGKWLKRKASLV
jgi:hypothetical protein